MTSPFELFVNEQRAELKMLRVILQTFLIRTIAADPSLAEERLRDLKESVTGALGRMQTDANDAGTERFKQLTVRTGEEFFEEIEQTLSQVRNTRGESGRN